jgi:hypothetical protein
MSDKPRAILDPIDRFSEISFGLIMALTVTNSLQVASAGQAEIRAMLVAALSCNIGWGIVDGVMFLVTGLAERSRRFTTLQAIHQATPGDGPRLLDEALPQGVSGHMAPGELKGLWVRVRAVPMPPRPTMGWDDLRAALAVVVLVFLSTCPVLVPFLVVPEPRRALHLSNGVAIVMLFGMGAALGRLTSGRWLRAGLAMVAIGSALVALTMALGG